MAEPLIVKNTIEINAPATKVWDALINPEQTKKYMFGCEALSDWQVGSPLIWQMIYEGKDFVAVKGEIVNIRPGEFLEYTVIDPHSEMPDIPENYLTVAYGLTEADGKTTLTVTQSGFEGAADGEKRYKDVYNSGEGWNPILAQIKALV